MMSDTFAFSRADPSDLSVDKRDSHPIAHPVVHPHFQSLMNHKGIDALNIGRILCRDAADNDNRFGSIGHLAYLHSDDKSEDHDQYQRNKDSPTEGGGPGGSAQQIDKGQLAEDENPRDQQKDQRG